MGNENLVRAFDKAGLKLEVQEENRFVRTNVAVFGMGINHRPKGDEFWMAPSDAKVEALNLDRKEGQIILFVKEKARFFNEMQRKISNHPLTDEDRRQMNVVREEGHYIWVRRRAEGDKRHFLMGHDERPKHYFIAQLPRAAPTIAKAHEVLRNPSVPFADGKVVRQGEWFFLELNPDEKKALEVTPKSMNSVGRKVPIIVAFKNGSIFGRQMRGHPHIAEELMVVTMGFTELGNRKFDIFVRGKIRHEEHDTVEFKNWRKVVKNTEMVDSRSGLSLMRGISWVD